jgi:hypothetical protein
VHVEPELVGLRDRGGKPLRVKGAVELHAQSTAQRVSCFFPDLLVFRRASGDSVLNSQFLRSFRPQRSDLDLQKFSIEKVIQDNSSDPV